MIASLELFQRYSNVFIDNEDSLAVELQRSYIDFAEEEVENFLGYDPGEGQVINPKTLKLENVSEVPRVIVLTVLRIAALLQAESDGSIGVTSKSWGDGGARTFVNYTNFQKFLTPIARYKLIRL